MGEAAEALERFNGNLLYFSDETTLYSPQRVREMLHELKKLPTRVEYSVSSRFDILERIDDDLLMEMKHTGCRIVGLGIESGSDRILKTIGKKFSSETIQQGLERLRKVGILPTVSIMVGQYTETIEDVEASIKLMQNSVRSNKNIQYAFTITTPFPGSQLYQTIFQKGLLKDDKEFYERYFQHKDEFQAVVNLSDMTDKEVRIMYEKIQRIYREEKSRTLTPGVNIIESLICKLAVNQDRLERKLFAPLKKNSILNELMRFIPLEKLQNWVYERIQIHLDALRLKLRGLKK